MTSTQPEAGTPHKYFDFVSDERLDVIEVNECSTSDLASLSTMRFRRVFNELEQSQRALTAANARIGEVEELHRMQLAAIGVAVMLNTRQSLDKQRIYSDNPYWTITYEDAINTVNREIAERERAEQAESKLSTLSAEKQGMEKLLREALKVLPGRGDLRRRIIQTLGNAAINGGGE